MKKKRKLMDKSGRVKSKGGKRQIRFKTRLAKHRVYGYGNVITCKHNVRGHCTWYGESCQDIAHDIHEQCPK